MTFQAINPRIQKTYSFRSRSSQSFFRSESIRPWPSFYQIERSSDKIEFVNNSSQGNLSVLKSYEAYFYSVFDDRPH